MNHPAAAWTTLWLHASLLVSAGLLTAALLLSAVRAVRGPREPDRLAALALIVTVSVGVMAVLAVARADWRYLDIALVLSLVFGAVPIAVARASKGRAAEVSSEEKGVTHVIGD